MILQAQPEDIDAIAALEKQIFSDAMTAGLLSSSMDRNLFFVAKDGESVLGYFLGTYVLDEMEVLRIAVSPERRGQGYGRALLNVAKKAAVALGITRCFLEVRESNAVAIALYRSMGFTPCGRRVRFYRQPDEDAILMQAQWDKENE